MKLDRSFDQGKVPDDFPVARCLGRLSSQGGKPYVPYYKAEEVHKWFRKKRREGYAFN